MFFDCVAQRPCAGVTDEGRVASGTSCGTLGSPIDQRRGGAAPRFLSSSGLVWYSRGKTLPATSMLNLDRPFRQVVQFAGAGVARVEDSAMPIPHVCFSDP